MYSVRDFTQNLRGNLFGGVTAAVVALPLALAFGISSGVGPIAGLFGAICVGFFAAVFGGTAPQISGPTGPMTVVMTAMTTEYLAQYPDDGLVLAFTTVFLGGCLQILFGILRIGKYIIMVPYPVISGFMTGIGVIIILLELGPLLGFASPANIIEAVSSLPTQVTSAHVETLLIGLLSLTIIYSWRGRFNQVMPAPLLALIIATLAALFFGSNAGISQIGAIPTALPSLHIPSFRYALLEPMAINAIMLAVLGSIDSLLTSLVADNITGTQHHSDRELVGQGIGNAVAGLLGGLPGAGATMRTMVNIRAGGTGPLSGVIHALILLGIVSGLGFLFENIPLAALAGILIKVGIDIIDWPFLRRLLRIPKFPALLMLTVLFLTVFVDLITAVFVGVFIKNLVTISKLSDLQLGQVIFSDGTTNLERLPIEEQNMLSEHTGEAVLFRITGPISYAVGRNLGKRFRDNIKSAKVLLIDITDAAIVGISSAMVLEEVIRKALASNTVVKLIGVHVEKHQELKQLGLVELVGKENCVDNVYQAFNSKH